jgi:transcription antitermination factor NusB
LRLRTIARIAAMKYLYESDVRKGLGCEAPEEYVRRARIPRNYQEYSLQLIRGCLDGKEEIDRLIGEAAANWNVDRMAVIDRNLLRIAAYEMTKRPDIPPRVAINEAVEMAKMYSTERSGAFVNGILDRILTLTRRKDDVRTDSPGT